jgi:hypothetical protein
MAKYDALFGHLVAADAGPIEMSFDEIEWLVGPLTVSALKHSAWWSNERPDTRHVQALAWLKRRTSRRGRRPRSTTSAFQRSALASQLIVAGGHWAFASEAQPLLSELPMSSWLAAWW